MKKEKKNFHEENEEEINMAVLAKPINRMPLVKKEESRDFVREFNSNKVSTDFLKSCKKAGKLFGKQR